MKSKYKTRYIRKHCKMCRNESEFVSTESPEGYWVCTKCGFRTSFGRFKLIINQFGYYFVDTGKIEE